MEPDAGYRKPRGNSANYVSTGGGLQGILDRLNTDGGWGKAASFAGSLIPKQGFGNVAGGALSGAGTGASIGASIGGPVGAGIGAAGGAIVGAIKGGADWKSEQHQKQMEALMSMRNRFNG